MLVPLIIIPGGFIGMLRPLQISFLVEHSLCLMQAYKLSTSLISDVNRYPEWVHVNNYLIFLSTHPHGGFVPV